MPWTAQARVRKQVVIDLVSDLKQMSIATKECGQVHLDTGPKSRTAIVGVIQVLDIVVAQKKHDLFGKLLFYSHDGVEVVQNLLITVAGTVHIISHKDHLVIFRKVNHLPAGFAVKIANCQ